VQKTAVPQPLNLSPSIDGQVVYRPAYVQAFTADPLGYIAAVEGLTGAM